MKLAASALLILSAFAAFTGAAAIVLQKPKAPTAQQSEMDAAVEAAERALNNAAAAVDRATEDAAELEAASEALSDAAEAVENATDNYHAEGSSCSSSDAPSPNGSAAQPCVS